MARMAYNNTVRGEVNPVLNPRQSSWLQYLSKVNFILSVFVDISLTNVFKETSVSPTITTAACFQYLNQLNLIQLESFRLKNLTEHIHLEMIPLNKHK